VKYERRLQFLSCFGKNLFPLCKANLLSFSLIYTAVNIAILSNGYRR
jgi:hypothetical protein